MLLALSACGSSGDDRTGGTPARSETGGRLTVLWSGDVDNIDPGITWYQFGYMVVQATQRPLLSYRPDDPMAPVPDLAATAPVVSRGATTVTVRLRRGVRFSPPVDREVVAADVKYAIERGFFRTVANPYAPAYFGDLVGARAGARPGTAIAGIETPDEHTVVFRLRRATGGLLAAALVLPLTAAVPPEYALPFDRHAPSRYGAHQVATGAYMIENDWSGRLTGYEPGRRIRLVRNPSWRAETDYRPAHLDEIDMPQGNSDAAVASQQILRRSSMVSGDFLPPPTALRAALRDAADQVIVVPVGGLSFMSLNTTVEPFDDVDVRRAVAAGVDREAIRLARGGAVTGPIATHILPPGVPGHDEAGGRDGFGLDFLASPSGDAGIAAGYLRRAGFRSGRYDGDGPLLMVGSSNGSEREVAEIAKASLERLGFEVRLRVVTQDVMLARFCAVPAADVAVCPNGGWGRDFADAQTILDPMFNGARIAATGNGNWSELDDPAINAAIERARLLTNPGERARAWAAVDRMVVEQAPVVPLMWGRMPLIRSADVSGIVNRATATWDLAFTSLE